MPRITNEFAADTEGWSVNADGRNLRWETGTGDGGYLTADDSTSGQTWYFVAPEQYRGDQSDKFRTDLQYAIRQGSLSSQFDDADIRIEGSAGLLTFAGVDAPELEFGIRTVRMTAPGWQFDDGSGARDATNADFRTVLADVDSLEIRGEYRIGGDTASLDTVSWGTGSTGGGTGGALPSLIYTFDDDAQGWDVNADARSFQWVEVGTGGHIAAADRASGDIWYFVAPEPLLGDQSGRYGSSFVFDLKQQFTDAQFDSADLVLTGTAGVLTFDTDENPGLEFTSYDVPMVPEGWTFTNGATTRDATEADMRAVLSDLTGLEVRGEFRGGSDSAALDNVGWTGEGAIGGIAIAGTNGANDLAGTDGDDVIDGMGGDDIIRPGGGNDSIDGGTGTDTIVYDFDRDDLEESVGNDGTITVTAGDDKTDSVANVERIELSDGVYAYDLVSDNLSYIYRLYDSAFARTPDEPGLRFWLNSVDSGGVDINDLAAFFVDSPEFADKYGAMPSDEVYINALYQNSLRRVPDDDGFDFWVDAFGSGTLDRVDMLELFSDSPENVLRNVENLDDGVWLV